MRRLALDRWRTVLRRFVPGTVVPAGRVRVDASPVLWAGRLRWLSRRWLRILGWPGVLAVAGLAILPVFYLSAIRPLQAQLDDVSRGVAQQYERKALARKSGSVRVRGPDEQLAEYYGFFPPVRSAPQWLEKLVALAERRGISLDQGEYQVDPDKVGKLVRFQMTLPVKGEYPQIRRFLADLPAELPVAALEKIQFERHSIADPQVEARIRLVLYLGRTP